MIIMDATFKTALEAFVAAAQEMIVREHSKMGYKNVQPSKLTWTDGRRYVRIIQEDGPSRSCYCFVDKTDGSVLKAASWKAPAKGIRGSIYSAQKGLEAVDQYGARYFR